ncbi:MAG TPA: amino acid--tRNA ligase-related protein, partial [Fodinibius sp.]|nr:amino acid--tRNA ligase-related protein [Fodinibius sp.]
MVYINNLADHKDQQVTLKGWIYNFRSSKNLYFLEVRDGSGLCQCVVAKDSVSEEAWTAAGSLRQESSLEISGMVVEDERSIGGYELQVTDMEIIHIAEDYPISLKEHGVDFLMENRHLWLRSQRQWAVMRVRSEIIYAIHTFFQERGFVQMDAPIFTGNAAEGTTNLFETAYFEDEAYLTQSGQLYGEAMAMAHGLIYTFGPTFRAEKSKTRRHLTEFWMIEPEMAFYDLDMNMELAEDFISFVVKRVLDRRSAELEILGRDTAKLEKTVAGGLPRISYTEAVETLRGDDMAVMLDQMTENREQEQTSLYEEREEIKKERGQAKKWRKSQIDQHLKDIGARLDQIEEDLRNI